VSAFFAMRDGREAQINDLKEREQRGKERKEGNGRKSGTEKRIFPRKFKMSVRSVNFRGGIHTVSLNRNL
jgi:hypothetical protein